jgi:foldase protein PrsA
LTRHRLIAALTLASALLGGLAGCGGQTVAVRVGSSVITTHAVAHWMAVMAPEHVVPDPPSYTACAARERQLAPPSVWPGLTRECRREYHTLERQALDFLISSAWLTGTVAEDGPRISDREVAARLRERAAPVIAEGGDPADQQLAARTELAEAKIREGLAGSERMVSAAEIVSYYRAHRSRFLVPEKRYLDVENLKSMARALRIKREVAAGHSANYFSGVLHEVIEQPSRVSSETAKDTVRSAILKARPDVLIGPLLNGEYALVEVRRIVPARYRLLAQVRASIARRLAGEQQRATLSRFIGAWRTRWIAITDCQPGYVVQRCRQYTGPMAPEDPLAFG